MRYNATLPEHVRQAMLDVFGMEHLTEFELAHTLSSIHNLAKHAAEAHFKAHFKDDDLSVARVRLLMWLLVSERAGGIPAKVSPTMLSHYHNVSRNTISALLSGLEDQGLIERVMDPEDRRRFHIKLTDAGLAVALERAPALGAHAAKLFDCLTPEEQQTLLHLLGKLLDRLMHEICPD